MLKNILSLQNVTKLGKVAQTKIAGGTHPEDPGNPICSANYYFLNQVERAVYDRECS